jgi:hypothetical protein
VDDKTAKVDDKNPKVVDKLSQLDDKITKLADKSFQRIGYISLQSEPHYLLITESFSIFSK